MEEFDRLLRFNAFAVLFRYEALEEAAPVFEREQVIEEIDALLSHVAHCLQ